MRSSSLLIVGVNYRTAPLSLRDALAIPSVCLPETLVTLRRACTLNETVVLSTCNRLEVYAVTVDPAQARRAILESLSARSGASLSVVAEASYTYEGPDVARHLFRVAAGLDSMVLGESEILAQVKLAYGAASMQGTTGRVLNRLFQKALHNGKVIRTQTRVAAGAASIGSVVVQLAQRMFPGPFGGRSVLLWGAGKAAETTARHLIKHGVGELWVVNRTLSKAQELARLCQGGWLSWEAAIPRLAQADLAVICTQAPHYVLDAGDVQPIAAARSGRPLCLIDLAVPRNIDPAVAHVPGVTLYNIDDLQTIAQSSLAEREQERQRCEALIEHHVTHFGAWWQRSQSQHTEDRCAQFAAL